MEGNIRIYRLSQGSWYIPSKRYILCVFNSINTIVTDLESNIRIYRLHSGRGMDHEIDISLACFKVSINADIDRSKNRV
jgi:hypothetical protein